MAEIEHPHIGATRSVIRFQIGAEPVVLSEDLYVEIPEDMEPLNATVVVYTIDLWRLTGMLDAARAGATNDELLLALDAAALPRPDDDG